MTDSVYLKVGNLSYHRENKNEMFGNFIRFAIWQSPADIDTRVCSIYLDISSTSLNTKTDNVLPAAKILSKSDIRILLLSCCCCCCYTFVSMLLGEKLDTEKYFSSFEHNNLTLKFKIVNGAIKTKAS